MRPARALALTAIAGVGAAAAGLGYGLAEANAFTVRRVNVPLLPAGARGIRVLHLSDIHLMPYQKAKLRFVSRLAGLEPDLVVNTGDNIASPESIEPLLAALGRLLDVPGVFVFGSNDYKSPTFRNPAMYLFGPSKGHEATPETELPWHDLRDAFVGRGWTDLNHHRAMLDVAGLRIAARGTDDAHLRRDDYSLVAGPDDQHADLSIGVTHAPYLRILDAMADDGLDIIFAGHTHGGQVCIPFKGALTTNCDLDAARVKGLSSHEHDRHYCYLHVSGGIGTSPFAPYRVACRPEATLVTITSVDRFAEASPLVGGPAMYGWSAEPPDGDQPSA